MQTVTTLLTDAGPISPSGPSEASQSSASDSQFGDVLNQELNSQQKNSKQSSNQDGKNAEPQSQKEAANETDAESVEASAKKASSDKPNNAQSTSEENSTEAEASALSDGKSQTTSENTDKASQLAMLRRGAANPAQEKENTQASSSDESSEESSTDVLAQGKSKAAKSAATASSNGQATNAQLSADKNADATLASEKKMSAAEDKAAKDNANFLGMLKQAKQTKTNVQQHADDSAGGIDQRAGMSDKKQVGQLTDKDKVRIIGQQAQEIKQQGKGASDHITPVLSPEKAGKEEAQVLDFTVPNKIKQAMDAAQAQQAKAGADSDGETSKVVNMSDNVFSKAELAAQQSGSSTSDKPFTLLKKQEEGEKSAEKLAAGEQLTPEPTDEISPIKVGDEISPVKDEKGINSELLAEKAPQKTDAQQIVEKAQAEVKQAAVNTASQAQSTTQNSDSVEAQNLVAEAAQEKANDNKGNSGKSFETTEAALKAQNSNTEAASQQQGEQSGEHSQQGEQQQSDFAELLNQSEVNTTERPRQSGQDSSIAMSTQPASASKVSAAQNTNALNQPKPTADVEAQINETIHTSKANFAVAAHERVMLMSNNGVNFADIRLDPADLGKMQIKMTQDGDQVNVSFIVQQPHAKEALENALPKLKELLAEQGIELGEGAISQESPKREADKDGGAGSGSGNQYAQQQELDAEEAELENVAANHIRIAGGALGGIDYFA